MDIDIEIRTDKSVPEDFIRLVYKVVNRYNLEDWKIIVWDLDRENECIKDMKIIYVYGYSDLNRLCVMFLHEVAHAIIDYDNINESHGFKWRQAYRDLLSRYLTLDREMIK